MNLFSFTCLCTIAIGTLFGASIGFFAYGADVWTSTGMQNLQLLHQSWHHLMQSLKV